jgi:hypothetical protein
VSSFIQVFGFDEDGEPPEEHVQPAWLGPPEDELGVATPLTLVLGRSERGAVVVDPTSRKTIRRGRSSSTAAGAAGAVATTA